MKNPSRSLRNLRRGHGLPHLRLRQALESLEQRTLMAATTVPITATVVDPADGLRLSVNDEKPSVVVGDWATDGNADSWVSTGASSTVVAGGTITETSAASGTPITISRTGIAAGPQTIEYGYYDYVQLRMQLPAGYSGGDVTFNYGTSITVPTSQAAVTSPARSFTIPGAQLATDGAFHTYRINVGKAVYWEGNIVGLRLSVPSTAASQDVSLDYLEVGDLPNSTLAISPTTQHIGNSAGYLEYPTTANGGAYNISPTDGTWQSVQSKHYIYYYDTAANPGGVNQVTAAHNTLEQLEQSLRIYTQVLGFKDAFSWAGGLHGGEATRFKLNITSWFSGYFSGGFYLNVDTSGANNTTTPTGYTVNEAPGSPIPHEYGHVTDTQNGAYLAGGHWESHANWYREQWVNWYGDLFASEGLPRSAYTGMGNRYSNLHIDNSRLIYNDWRIYTPLQYYAASLGMDVNAAAKLWSQGSTNQTIIDKLTTLVPAGSSIKDVVGTLMQYWPTLDFPVRADMKSAAFPTASALADFNFQSTSYLAPEADKPGWYTVPAEKAPEKYGYMTHVLTPTPGSTSISLTFNGLPSTDATADWRWSLQAVGADGVTRYSPLYGNGATGTLAILPTDTKVMLVVTATPGNTTLDLDSKHNTKQDTQNASRLIYPYEVTMTGAAPATGAALRIAYTRSGSGAFRTNPDGSAGGWVDSSATVASTAYVAVGAQVLGTAKVQGTARILDFATVAGNATVSGNAIISGYAVVNGSAQVSGNARVRDFAMVTTNAIVNSNAVIEQYATLNNDLGQSVVTGNAVVRGVALMQGGTVGGTAILEYDYTFNWSFTDGTHAGNYPYDGDWVTYYENSQVKPRGLIASYRVNETAGQYLFDEFGTLNGLIGGTPTRVNDGTRNSNVLSLNGSTQSVTLDRSIAALVDGTYSIWVNPTSATADQPLLYFGSSANTYLKLVARDANGFAHLTISVNGVVKELVSSVAVPLNTWTNLAVTFASAQATIYVNGSAAGTAAMTYRPTDVLPSGSFGSAESIFLGRDIAGNFFTGSVDDFRVYNVALTPAEIAAELKRSGTIIGTADTAAPVTFSTSTAESGVHDGQTRTISAWIKPNSSASVTDKYYNTAYYTPIVDSTDERHASSSSQNGSGLGINNGFFVATLDGAGMWVTGIPVAIGQWQQVTLTFNGALASLYVNGVLRATKTYTVNVANIAGKNYRIGYGQTTTDQTSRTYFDGQIFDLEIADRVVAPTVTLPAGWTTADIGTVGATGTAAFNRGNWALTGSGVGATGTADAFRFASTSVSGDATITALVTKPAQFTGTTNTAATAGVMFRTTTATNASEMMLALTPAGSLVFQYRATLGGATTTVATQAGITGPAWLRLVRSTANGVSAFYSTDGVNFTQLGSTVSTLAGAALPSTLLAGLAVTSHVSATLAQALFAGVSVVSNPAPTIATPATATLDAGGTSATLSVLGADDGGEAGLTYIWTAVGNLPGPISFSVNGNNAAKTTSVNLLNSGTYTFVVSIFDATGAVVSSAPVTLTLTPAIASLGPAGASVIGGGTQQFTAFDQYGQPIAANLITWSTTAGSITAAGLYTAPPTGASAIVSAAVAGSPAVTTTVSVVGPRLWLKNDNIVAGNTIAADSSGNNRNGTLSATSGFSSSTGEIGNALTLAGSTVTLPSSAIAGATDFTVAAWVKLTAVNSWARLFDFGTGTTKYMFLTPYDGAGHVRFAITTSGNAGEQLLDSTTTLTTGVWSHLAVTLSGTTSTLYVNGVAVSTNTSMTLNPSSLGVALAYIGKSFFGDPNLQASVDDFRVYGAAASSQTVASMYAAGVASATAAPTNVSAVAATASRVDVSWTDNSSIETGYLIERATNAAFTAGLTSFNAAASATTFADTTVVGGTTYYYRVTTLLPTAVTAGPAIAPAVSTPVSATVTSSSHQYDVSPNTVTYVFSTDVGSSAFSVGSLTVLAADSSPVTVTGYSYVPATHSAIFTLAAGLADGNYTATLAKGSTLAADSSFGFFIMTGDIDHDRSVGFSDLLILAKHYGMTGSATFADGDINFDGNVDFSDLLALAKKYGQTLAAPAAPQFAVAATPATTSTRRTAVVASVIG